MLGPACAVVIGGSVGHALFIHAPDPAPFMQLVRPDEFDTHALGSYMWTAI